MTWSYSGDPSNSNTDAVRFLIGDTDSADQQMSDEEIGWLVSEAGSTYAAAVLACDGLAAKYARQTDKSAGEMSVKSSQRVEHYTKLAKRLRQRAVTRAIPFAGGISKTSKEAYEEDDDRVKPAFERDMHSKHENIEDLESD